MDSVAKFTKGTGYSKGDLVDSGTPIILYGRLYTNYQTTIRNVDTFVVEKENSVFSRGGEVIVPASGETAEDIARASVVENGGVLLGGDLNIIEPEENINSSFLALTISNGNPQKELAKKAQGKSVVHIRNDEIKRLLISLPIKVEQDKIEKYFANLDHLITLHQRKYRSLRKTIWYAWEQRKLGDVFKEYSEKNHTELPTLTIIQGGGTVKREDSDRNLMYNESNLSNYKMVRKDDFIVHLRSFEGGLEKSSLDGIISPAYHTFHSDVADTRFYYPYFRSYEFIKHKLVLHVYGIRDGRSIDIGGMKTIEIPYTSMVEQRKIGDYLESLDHLITLHQRELFYGKSVLNHIKSYELM